MHTHKLTDSVICTECLMAWKRRVMKTFLMTGKLNAEECQWQWDTYQDMISALILVMNGALGVDEPFTESVYESLITD